MMTINSFRELKDLLQNFKFEDIGFKKINEDPCTARYFKKRSYRPDLYIELNLKTNDAQVYRCDPVGQPDKIKGTFNIRRPDELLFLLTHCLNEIRAESPVLNRCKQEIGYDQTEILPMRRPHKC